MTPTYVTDLNQLIFVKQHYQNDISNICPKNVPGYIIYWTSRTHVEFSLSLHCMAPHPVNVHWCDMPLNWSVTETPYKGPSSNLSAFCYQHRNYGYCKKRIPGRKIMRLCFNFTTTCIKKNYLCVYISTQPTYSKIKRMTLNTIIYHILCTKYHFHLADIISFIYIYIYKYIYRWYPAIRALPAMLTHGR